MTSEVKNFIELSDILRMRFECRSCKAVLELALDDVKEGTIRECPICHDGWSAFHGPGASFNNHEGAFTGLAKGIKKIYELDSSGAIGFSLKLEIKPS